MRYFFLRFKNLICKTSNFNLEFEQYLFKWQNFFKEAFLFDYIYKKNFNNLVNTWVYYNIIIVNILIINYNILRPITVNFYKYFFNTKENFFLNWFKAFYLIFSFIVFNLTVIAILCMWLTVLII